MLTILSFSLETQCSVGLNIDLHIDVDMVGGGRLSFDDSYFSYAFSFQHLSHLWINGVHFKESCVSNFYMKARPL